MENDAGQLRQELVHYILKHNLRIKHAVRIPEFKCMIHELSFLTDLPRHTILKNLKQDLEANYAEGWK